MEKKISDISSEDSDGKEKELLSQVIDQSDIYLQLESQKTEGNEDSKASGVDHYSVLMRRTQLKAKPKMGYMLILVLNMALTGVLVGYAMAYQNQLNRTFFYKLGWTEENKGMWEGILGSSVVLGMVVGASSSGKWMENGRRQAIIWCSLIGIIGCLTTQIFNIYVIIFGRVLFGMSSAALVTIGYKFLEETIPSDVYEVFSPLIMSGNSTGTLTAFLLGLTLPDANDITALSESGRWRVFYAYVPIGMYALLILGVMTIGKHDSINFLIKRGKTEEAKKAIMDLYKDQTEKSAEYLMNEIKSTFGEDNEEELKVTTWDVFFNEQYNRATWVNIGYMFFHEVAGINVIYQYSTQIYKDMHDGDPRVGTIILGVTSLIATLTSIVLMKYLSRRAVFIGGHVGVCISWLIVSYYDKHQNQVMIAFGMNMFMFIYMNTSGTVAWTYAAETCNAASLGYVIMSIYVNVIYLAIVCPILLDPTSLGPSIVFMGLSAFSALGALYCWYFIKETKGLKELEKKLLYNNKQTRESVFVS